MMKMIARTAAIAAGVAAAFAAVLPQCARAADLAPSLQSFGAAKVMSAYEVSAAGVTGFALAPQVQAALNNTSAAALPLSSFAASTVLAPNLALDAGTGIDIGARFVGYDGAASPFLTPAAAPFLALADGGRYGGITFIPAANLRMRLGTSVNSERLDGFHFDPSAPAGNLALTYNASQTRSLLAGLSWNVSDALGLDVAGISADRSGVPLGLADAAAIAPKASINALGVSAHMNVGQGWVTTASFSEGLTQLDQRSGLGDGLGTTLHEQSYSIAVAKHGLFGDDTLGLSFSRPAASLSGGFSGLAGIADLPPLVVAQGAAVNPGISPETDIQLGYVTNFLNGAVALQTNAAYQTNFQGQPGTSSVSLLSRAKIKF